MDPRHAQTARGIAAVTRLTLVLLGNVERGLLPMKALTRFVDPAALAAYGPIPPWRPGRFSARPQVGRIRVHLVHPALAHVACVARRPDGRMAGYVLEVRHDRDQGRWRIAELSRAHHRTLAQRHPDRAPDDLWFGDAAASPPAGLTARIQATVRARHDAAAALDAAEARLAELRAELAPLRGGKKNWQIRKRAPLYTEEGRAREVVDRCRQTVARLDRQLRELRETRELRDARSRILRGDPLMNVRDPGHLERLLGPIPDDPQARASWRNVASAVETYRYRWDITDPDDALGALPPHAPPEQRAHRAAAARSARAYRLSQARTAERTREPRDQPELGF